MKILVLTSSSDRPESALIAGLARNGHKLLIFGEPSAEHRARFAEIVDSVEFFAPKTKFDLKASARLKATIRDWKPDIVHAFTGRTLAAAVRSKTAETAFKLVAYRGTIGHLSHYDPATVLSFLSPKVDAISCVSNAVKRYLLSKDVPQERLFTIYKGHDPSWYQDGQTISREQLKMTDNHFVVTCVANSRPVKGVDVFIEAANSLKENSSIKFLVVGQVRDKKLFALSRTPHLQFLGFRTDAHKIIAQSDCVAVPSRGREGLPRALLEALAAKKAVIASAIGGIPEIISHEKEGLLIPPNDPALLARAISYLQLQPERRMEMGGHGYARLLSQFNVENTVTATEAMYQQLMS